MLLVSESILSEDTGRVWYTERHHWAAGPAKNRAQLMPAGTRTLIIDSTFPITEVTGVNKATWEFLRLHKKNPELLLAEGRNGAAVEARTSCAARPARDTKASLTEGSDWHCRFTGARFI